MVPCLARARQSQSVFAIRVPIKCHRLNITPMWIPARLAYSIRMTLGRGAPRSALGDNVHDQNCCPL